MWWRLLLLLLIATPARGQERIIVDTSNLSQDMYFCYFHLPGDTTVKFQDYKYQYRFKKLNRKSVNRLFKFDGCQARIFANQDSISIGLINDCGPRHFRFILWLKDVIYIVHIDGGAITRVCKIDERIDNAGCRKTFSG